MNYINNAYNNNNNRGIMYFTPNELWNDISLVDKIHDKSFNIEGNKYFEVGSHVRILNKKNVFDKENQNYSRNIYSIIDKIKNKYKLQDIKNNNIL